MNDMSDIAVGPNGETKGNGACVMPAYTPAPKGTPPRPITEILAERQHQHGDYSDHAEMTQHLKLVMRGGKNWGRLTPEMLETLEMIAHKVGRILSGDPDHQDHWDDIAGYATLVSQRL
jgi:hypothetical protein